jgi:hypothetical protein
MFIHDPRYFPTVEPQFLPNHFVTQIVLDILQSFLKF